MKSMLRKIGNSRGVLIPASFLTACEIDTEIELRMDGKRIIIEPVHAPRAGWFDNYQSGADEPVWPEMEETELDEWQW